MCQTLAKTVQHPTGEIQEWEGQSLPLQALHRRLWEWRPVKERQQETQKKGAYSLCFLGSGLDTNGAEKRAADIISTTTTALCPLCLED